jgi:RHS repeat-associated protein
VKSNNVVVLENWYDALGRRIAKRDVSAAGTVSNIYVWDGWMSIATLNASNQTVESYSRGPGLAGDIGTLVAVTHHAASYTNGTFYTHNNHRGDIVMTRSGSTTEGTYDYGAFGTLNSQTGTDVCRFKFSSKELDASAGLYYYGYRFYAPQWQRWVNRDPREELGFVTVKGTHHDSTTMGYTSVILNAPLEQPLATRSQFRDPRIIGLNASLPQDDTNLYQYAYNDPVDMVDPTGLGPPSECIIYSYYCLMGDSYACVAQAVCAATGDNHTSNCIRNCLLDHYHPFQSTGKTACDHIYCYAKCL